MEFSFFLILDTEDVFVRLPQTAELTDNFNRFFTSISREEPSLRNSGKGSLIFIQVEWVNKIYVLRTGK
jgi:hypothetical protein